MIVTMQVDASQEQIDGVAEAIRLKGFDPLILPGANRVAIGIPAALDADQRADLEALLGSLEGVARVTQTSQPFKLASREYHRHDTVVKVGGVEIGGGSFVMMGGPCSIESLEQFEAAAAAVKAAGATILRGGAFKPRTSPYSFQGLAEEGLSILQSVGRDLGLVTVTEVMSGDMVPLVSRYADILQIGARSMQNYPLLVEVGRSGKPVLLKRGPAAPIDEFLLAAEYLLSNGNPDVILCERGIVALDRSYARNTLDLAAVPVLKEQTHLPVIVDPSHGVGVARYVAPMAKAALAAGADGLMVEMHPNPKVALSDGGQALTPPQFSALMDELRALAPHLGKRL